jgi:hypothetical protein
MQALKSQDTKSIIRSLFCFQEISTAGRANVSEISVRVDSNVYNLAVAELS